MLNRLKKRSLRRKRENEGAKIGSFNFSQLWSEGGNRSSFNQKFIAPALSSASVHMPKLGMKVEIERQDLCPK